MLEHPLTGISKINYDDQNRFYVPKNMRRLLEINNHDYWLDLENMTLEKGYINSLDSAGRLSMPNRDYKYIVGQGHFFQFLKGAEPVNSGKGYGKNKQHPYFGIHPVKVNSVGRVVIPKSLVKSLEQNVDELYGVYMAFDKKDDKLIITERPEFNFIDYEFVPIDSKNNITVPTRFKALVPKGEYFMCGEFFKIALHNERPIVDVDKMLDGLEKYYSIKL